MEDKVTFDSQLQQDIQQQGDSLEAGQNRDDLGGMITDPLIEKPAY